VSNSIFLRTFVKFLTQREIRFFNDSLDHNNHELLEEQGRMLTTNNLSIHGSSSPGRERLTLLITMAMISFLSFSCAFTQEQSSTHVRRGLSTILVPDRLEEPAANDAKKEKEKITADEDAVDDEKGAVSSEETSESPGVDDLSKKNKSGAGAESTATVGHFQPPARMIEVDIYYPGNNHIGDILVLPGWRFSRKRWQKETDLLKLAEEHGLGCVFPEMGISLYESEYFDESTLKWAATPGSTWITKVLIPTLQQKYGLFPGDGKNFLLGLSTGGRGVILVGLQNPGLFSAGAALSGDYNQTTMPHDRLISSIYGPYKKQMKRWHSIDNPEAAIISGKWNMPLYIGHGKRDRIVPFQQSLSLNDSLKKYHPKVHVTFSAPENAGHDFKYWSSEVPHVIKFFLDRE